MVVSKEWDVYNCVWPGSRRTNRILENSTDQIVIIFEGEGTEDRKNILGEERVCGQVRLSSFLLVSCLSVPST